MYVALLLPLMVAVTRRYCGVEFRGLARGISVVVRDVLVMSLALVALRFAFADREPMWAILAMQVGTGGVIYLLAFRLMSAPELTDLVRALPLTLRRWVSRVLVLGSVAA